MPDTDLITRAGEFRPSSVNRDKRTATVMFSSGAPVKRRDWTSEYTEVLDVSPTAVRLDRLNNGAPLLDSHKARELASVLGTVERAWIENGQAFAEVRFRSTPEADAVLADVENGTLRNVSVGYVVHGWRIEETDGHETRTATDWEPFELSFVSIPAEVGAGVRSFTTDSLNEGGADMPQTHQAKPAARAERERITGITRAVRTAGLDEALADELIDSGVSIDKARARIFDLLAEKDEATDTRSHHRIQVGPNGNEADFRAAVVDGLLMREGVRVANAHPAAEDFRHASMRTICETLLGRQGVSVGRMSTAALVERALATSDLPALLANVAQKAAMVGFSEHAPGTHRAWVRQGSLADFKESHRVALSEMPALLPVHEHAEVTSGKLDDAREPIRLESFGRIVSLTRQAIINDDLGELTKIPVAFGAAARRLESDLVYEVLTGNPGMRDGKALFHADHGNLAATGGSLSVDTLGAARAAMRKQRGLAGEGYLDPTPRFLIVPVALETDAGKLLAELQPNSADNAVPEWISRLVVVADPRLDAASETAWYLAADPAQHDTIEIATLDGRGPQIQTKEHFDTAAMRWRCLFDVGCAALDWRGLYMNPGA